jgi:hypothetical protein
MNRAKHWVAALLIAAAVSPIAIAQQTKTATAPEGSEVVAPATDMVTRTYNVADLVRTAADYPFESAIMPPSTTPGNVVNMSGQINPKGLFGGGGQSGPDAEPKTGKPGIGIAELLTVIIDTISPDSWNADKRPADHGTARSLGSLLVITQSPDNHKRIQSLLDSIRGEYGPLKSVTVRVRWVLADSASPLDEASLQKLPPDATWAASRTTCFSGQTVSLSSGRGRTVMTKAEPVVGQNAVAYSSQTELVQSGAVLQVTPLLTPDGKSATLDLVSVTTEWNPLEQPIEVTGGGPANSATTRPWARLDRLNVGTSQLRTTVRLPVNKPTIIGSMTLDPGTDQRQLVLVAEVIPAAE